MQSQRVDILKGHGFQSNNCFEAYHRMLIWETLSPDANISTFWIMLEKYNHIIM